MRTHTQSKVCQLSRSEACLIPRRPSFLIIYHVGLLMTPPVSTARGPLQCVRASPCVSISVWICVCRHAQITCRSHLDWQHEKPPAPQHTHANTHAHFVPASEQRLTRVHTSCPPVSLGDQSLSRNLAHVTLQQARCEPPRRVDRCKPTQRFYMSSVNIADVTVEKTACVQKMALT